MPRRLIIGILVVLILGVIGGTIALVVNRLRSGATPEEVTQGPGTGSLQEATPGGQQVVDPTGDDDGDGLSNSDERIWGTNPQIADTDGDGFLDGEEVAAGHNPTIAGPDDLLPAGFVPGREQNTLQPATNAPIAVDQLFADNLDLSTGTRNLTEVYRQQYNEEQRTADTLVTFARSQPIITQLPRPLDDKIIRQESDSALAVSVYLETAGNLAVFSNRSAIASALTNLYENNNTSGVQGLAFAIRAHQENVAEEPVPPSAVNLHRLLLGYTELLAATYNLIATFPDDPAKSSVGLYQFEQIDRQFYPLIEQEVTRLEGLATS